MKGSLGTSAKPIHKLCNNLTAQDWFWFSSLLMTIQASCRIQLLPISRAVLMGCSNPHKQLYQKGLRLSMSLKLACKQLQMLFPQSIQELSDNPDVEQALVLWLRSMETKQETVNGPMLMEK